MRNVLRKELDENNVRGHSWTFRTVIEANVLYCLIRTKYSIERM